MHLFMPCEEAARLTSEERDHPLPWSRKVILRIHLVFCAHCRACCRKLAILSCIAARAGETVLARLPVGAGDRDVTLSSEARERIKHALDCANPRK